MNLLDILLILVVGSSVVASFIAGFARAGIGFFAAIMGVLFGFWFYWLPAGWIHKVISNNTFANICGFIFVFAVFLALGGLAGRLMAKLFKWTGLAWLDKILGAGFGLIRGTVVAAAFVAVLLAFVPKPPPSWMAGSAVLPYVLDASNVFVALAPRALKESFDNTVGEIKKDWNEEIHRADKKKKDKKSSDDR